jgi:hypothetical protein
MNIPRLFTIAVGAGVALGAAQAKEKHEEEIISRADVPMAAQKAAESEAKGGRIVRWEKEGKDYEAVIEKNGKKWGVEINGNGKVLSKHDEGKEHKEKGEKY